MNDEDSSEEEILKQYLEKEWEFLEREVKRCFSPAGELIIQSEGIAERAINFTYVLPSPDPRYRKKRQRRRSQKK